MTYQISEKRLEEIQQTLRQALLQHQTDLQEKSLLLRRTEELQRHCAELMNRLEKLQSCCEMVLSENSKLKLLIEEQKKELQQKSEQIVMLHQSDIELQKARRLTEEYKKQRFRLERELMQRETGKETI